MSDFGNTACPLHLRLFGAFDAQINGCPLPRLRSRKGQELLTLLVLRQGRYTERTWLASVLWPESTESQALANLRLSLTDLRKALGGEANRLHAPTPRALSFNLTGAWADVIAFDAAIRKGNAAALKAATAAYRGALLEGCEAEWLVPERLERAGAYYGALETLAGQSLAEGKNEEAISCLRKLIAVEPLRESACRLLMQALTDRSDYAAATQVYRDLRLYLHAELQTLPDPQTTACYKELCEKRKNTAAMPRMFLPATSTSLPAPLTRLIGRETEVAAVCASLDESRLVTLKGPGGAGKTRLAIAVGQQLQEKFAEQVWFVSLAEMPDAQRLAERVRDTLQIVPDQTDPFAQIVQRFRATPSLLILDNYEHLIEEGARFVQDLLASLPLLVCLVTSRRSLDLVGEIEVNVQPLACPAEVKLEDKSVPDLLQFPGVQLFVERAAARRAGFQLTQENARAVVALCAKLEGMPLAIELVAAWADTLTPSQMLTRLEERFSFPRNRKSEMPQRHGNLQGAFNSSYSLLDEAERRLLGRLAVFAGGWTLAAAEAVCSDNLIMQEEGKPSGRTTKAQQANSSSQMLVLLKRLVEKSLVLFHESQKSVDTEPEQPRYQLLEMTRQYALEHAAPDDSAHAERRHAEYFLQQALAEEAQADTREQTLSPTRKMQADGENYFAALRHWKAVGSDEAILLLTSLGSCGLIATYSSELREWIQRLEAQKLPPPSPLQAKLYYLVALWASYLTSPGWLRLMEKAYDLAEGCGDKVYMAHTLHHLGIHDIDTENTPRARKRLETSLGYFQQEGNSIHAAAVQQELIYVACAESDFVYAQEMGEALLKSGREKNSWYAMKCALEALAHVAEGQQDYPRAFAYGERAIALLPANETIARSNMLRRLSGTAIRQGEFQTARNYLHASIVICQNAGDPAHEAWAYSMLGDVARRQGDCKEGREWMRKALRLFDSLGETGSMLACLRGLARLAADQPESAVFLWSAYAGFNEERGNTLSAAEREEIDKACVSLRETISEESFAVIGAWSATMSLQQVVQYVLENNSANDPLPYNATFS